MVKVSTFKKDDGALLVIWKTLKENLVGEVFLDGVEKRGKNGSWDMRATFKVEDGDASEYRVCEYFGFDASKPYWSRY